MGILLFLLGLIALGSGVLKLRERNRTLIGTSVFAALEIVVGAITIVASGLGAARMRPLAWTLVAAVLIVITISGTVHIRRVLERHRRREASERARFERFVRGRER